VLHDFEIGGKSWRWFGDVVDRYSRTGHPHPHFSRSEMLDLLTGAGFEEVSVFAISDPFTLAGESPEEAKRNAIMHMYDMYDLIKLGDDAAEIESRLGRYIGETLGRIAVRQHNGLYIAEIPRDALVAVGIKPAVGTN
jgi:hypothetical protein